MLATLGLLLLSLATPPQAPDWGVQVLGAEPVGPALELEAEEYETAYRASVRAEREDALFRAWEAASEERRALATEVLGGLRSVGAPSEWRPDLGSIGVLTGVLKGDDPEAWLGEHAASSLAVQAMSIDLVVQPGVFAPTEAGQRPGNMTVVVTPLFELAEALDVTARLIWIAPDGTETVAREEPVAGRAFAEEGFRMYVRAPKGPLGLHKLVLELEPTFELAGEVKGAPVGSMLLAPVRSLPALVPCVQEVLQRNLGERLLASRGLALPPFLDGLASEWLADLAAGRETLPKKAKNSDIDLVWAAPKEISMGPCLAGEVGRHWREDLPARITVVRGSDAGGRSNLVHQALAEATRPGHAKVLVLDGDALVGAQLEVLLSGPYDVDALVVVAQSWRPTPTLPAVPTLFLTSDAKVAALAETLGEGRVEAVVLSDSTFLSSPRVPAHIAAFLDEHSLTTSRGGTE